MLKEQIEQDIVEAMKAKDETTLSVLRMLKSAVKNKEIETKKELEDADITAVIQSQIKSRRDSVEMYEKANRQELAKKENKEIEILQKYLPEQIGDSIFAIIAAEFGFVGATALILIFLILVLRTYLAAKHLHDPFGKLILVGFGTLIGTQAFMHVAAISGIIPLTGVPLPFISYGGTALIAFMTMSVIILNVSRQANWHYN